MFPSCLDGRSGSAESEPAIRERVPRILHHKTADNIFERFTMIKVKVKLDDVGSVSYFVFGNKRIIVYVLYVLYIIFLQFDPFIIMRALPVSPDNDGHGAGEYAEWRAPQMTGAPIN